MSKKLASKPTSEEVFKPTKEFSKKARISSMAQYKRLYKESIEKPSVFWAREAKELVWQKSWTKVLDWKLPYAKWFVGGKLNVCENCVDRHAEGPRKNKAAIIFEGEPFKGKPVSFFAYYSASSGAAPTEGWPAVVLVHGGGGTALANYVKEWNEKGYAAISLDWYGILLMLTQSGLIRDKAYRLVQRNAMRVWTEGLDFKGLLLKDKDVRKHLSGKEIEETFDLAYHLKEVDTIFRRVFEDDAEDKLA